MIISVKKVMSCHNWLQSACTFRPLKKWIANQQNEGGPDSAYKSGRQSRPKDGLADGMASVDKSGRLKPQQLFGGPGGDQAGSATKRKQAVSPKQKKQIQILVS